MYNTIIITINNDYLFYIGNGGDATTSTPVREPDVIEGAIYYNFNF